MANRPKIKLSGKAKKIVRPKVTIGTMIETPRAALCANELAEYADLLKSLPSVVAKPNAVSNLVCVANTVAIQSQLHCFIALDLTMFLARLTAYLSLVSQQHNLLSVVSKPRVNSHLMD